MGVAKSKAIYFTFQQLNAQEDVYPATWWPARGQCFQQGPKMIFKGLKIQTDIRQGCGEPKDMDSVLGGDADSFTSEEHHDSTSSLHRLLPCSPCQDSMQNITKDTIEGIQGGELVSFLISSSYHLQSENRHLLIWKHLIWALYIKIWSLQSSF